MITQLASNLGIDTDTIDLAFDSVTKELTYRLNFTHTLANAALPLSLGFDLAEGVADIQASTNASFGADVSLDMTLGVDIDDLAADIAAPGGEKVQALKDNVFIKAGAAVGANVNLSATNLNATALLGCLDIGIVNGNASANPSFTLSLIDPATNSADGRIDIQELIDNITNPGTLVTGPTIGGTGSANLPLAAPFLGITASVGTTIAVRVNMTAHPPGLTVQMPPDLSNLEEMFNFNNISSGGFAGLLGKIRDWLDGLRDSSMFSSIGIPFTDGKLSDVLAFAETLGDKLLFDNGADDEKDGADRLITDINTALNTAGIASRILAEASGAKIKLVSYDLSAGPFTLTPVSGAAQIGFNSIVTSVGDSGAIHSVTGSSDAPSNGQISSNAVFRIAFGSGSPVTVTVNKDDTTANTKIGDDSPKLLFADNTPSFDTVGELAGRLTSILGLPLTYTPADDSLTFNLNLSGGGAYDFPIDFDLDLSPLLELNSDTVVRLSANAGLTLTVGAYLGQANPSELLETTTLLTDLNGGDGVDIKTNRALTALQDVRSSVGRLSQDAVFKLSINGAAPVTVTVNKTNTYSNLTAADLAADVNTALTAAG